MKKLPENPFKETDKLAEKLTLDIADKTDKALVESLNDLIKAGILEIKVLQPHTEFHENCLTVKSGVQVVPKFSEYTQTIVSENFELSNEIKKLQSENSELKDELENLKTANSFLLDVKLNKNRRIAQLSEELEELKSKYDSLTENLTAAMEAADFLNKFLKLEK